MIYNLFRPGHYSDLNLYAIKRWRDRQEQIMDGWMDEVDDLVLNGGNPTKAHYIEQFWIGRMLRGELVRAVSGVRNTDRPGSSQRDNTQVPGVRGLQ